MHILCMWEQAGGGKGASLGTGPQTLLFVSNKLSLWTIVTQTRLAAQ